MADRIGIKGGSMRARDMTARFWMMLGVLGLLGLAAVAALFVLWPVCPRHALQGLVCALIGAGVLCLLQALEPKLKL